MSERYKIHVAHELYFITVTVIDWVDLLEKAYYKDIIINGFKYCQKEKDLHVHAFVIMSNHYHAIVSFNNTPLSDIMRDMKKYTSKQLINTIKDGTDSRKVWLLKKFEFAQKQSQRGKYYKVWQDGFHPVLLSDNIMIEQRLDYLHNNPVKAGLVYKPEDYVYSSASSYCGLPDTLLKLNLID